MSTFTSSQKPQYWRTYCDTNRDFLNALVSACEQWPTWNADVHYVTWRTTWRHIKNGRTWTGIESDNGLKATFKLSNYTLCMHEPLPVFVIGRFSSLVDHQYGVVQRNFTYADIGLKACLTTERQFSLHWFRSYALSLISGPMSCPDHISNIVCNILTELHRCLHNGSWVSHAHEGWFSHHGFITTDFAHHVLTK